MQDTCETLLQRLNALESQNQRLEAFSDAVVHQLKGPLYHIVGYTGFLRDVHAMLPAAKLHECLEMLRCQAKKAIELLEELQLLVDAEQSRSVTRKGAGERALEGLMLAGVLSAGDKTPG
jgi:light-regulated signal transduction histidine kinase (bacteriophytochrome)